MITRVELSDIKLTLCRNNFSYRTLANAFFISILFVTMCVLSSPSLTLPGWSTVYKVDIPYEASNPAAKQFFHPQSMNIHKGDQIIWTNMDEMMHSITGNVSSEGSSTGIFDSGALHTGQEFTYSFNEEGQYQYTCTFHPFMTGKISVS